MIEIVPRTHHEGGCRGNAEGGFQGDGGLGAYEALRLPVRL